MRIALYPIKRALCPIKRAQHPDKRGLHLSTSARITMHFAMPPINTYYVSIHIHYIYQSKPIVLPWTLSFCYIYLCDSVSRCECTHAFARNEWVVSHMNKSWHIRMRHIYMNACLAHIDSVSKMVMRVVAYLCSTWMSHVTYKRVVTHMNEPYIREYLPIDSVSEMVMRVDAYVRSRHLIGMSHGTYKWVVAHTHESWHMQMSHGTHKWVMAHMDE